jgi:hypothetical protein
MYSIAKLHEVLQFRPCTPQRETGTTTVNKVRIDLLGQAA